MSVQQVHVVVLAASHARLPDAHEQPPTFPTSLLATAARFPAATAAVTGAGDQLSYSALVAGSAVQAAALAALGVGRGDVVALEGDRSLRGLVTLVGIARAGAAYLPLEPDGPPDRLRAALEDAGARVVITTRPLPIPPGCLTVHPNELIGAPTDALPPAARATDPAYVLFTSGSTGRPKGVVMPHRALAHLLRWHARTEPDAGQRRTGQLAPWTFDASFQELFSTLCAGGTLVLLDDLARADPTRLLDQLSLLWVDRLFLPTALLQPLAEAGLRRADPPPLRDVIVAGSALRVSPAIRTWFARMAPCRLHNHYGPTESHVVTAHTLDGDPQDWPDVPPIGTVLPHAELAVAGPDGAPVAPGELGELVIGGACLSTGYASRPDETARRYRTDASGRPWYRTGDVVAEREGVLRYHGRVDRQVKIRGFRVEPSEIEAALMAATDLVDCIVVAEPGRADPRLVAYVVMAEAAHLAARRLDGARWASDLRRRLPDHMIPSVWMAVAALPLNANGKVDVAALPAPLSERPRSDVAFAPPSTASEALVCGIVEELLDVQPVGVDDSFFLLGGTSLAATRLAARVADESGRPLGVEDVLQERTPRRIASLLDARAPSRAPAVAAKRAPADPSPLSHAQRRFLLAELLAPGSEANVVVSAHHLPSPPDHDTLSAAIGDVLIRHPLLSATFDIETLTAHARPPRPGLLKVNVAPAVAGRSSAELAADGALAERRQPFDLTESAVRFRLTHLPDGSALLVLAAHHIVIDGWSEIVLLGDLSRAYAARAAGETPSWPSAPEPYAHHVDAEAAWLRSDAALTQRAWWNERLARVSDLPIRDPGAPGSTSATVVVAPPVGDRPAIVDHLTAYATALQAELDLDEDHAIGIITSGRTGPRFQATVGPFVNTVCVPIRFGDGRPTAEVCASALFAALAHGCLPFDVVVSENARRDGARHPLCQALLVTQSYDDARLHAPLGPGDRVALPEVVAPFDAMLATWPTRDGIAARFGVAAGVGPATLAPRLADDWTALAADREPSPA